MVILDDILVSIRMPESLFLKLKELVEKEHYMDVSEEIRSIVRQNWMKVMRPELLEIKRLRKDILDEIKKKSENEIAKKVAKELDEIKKKIREEEKS